MATSGRPGVQVVVHIGQRMLRGTCRPSGNVAFTRMSQRLPSRVQVLSLKPPSESNAQERTFSMEGVPANYLSALGRFGIRTVQSIRARQERPVCCPLHCLANLDARRLLNPRAHQPCEGLKLGCRSAGRRTSHFGELGNKPMAVLDTNG